MSRPKPPNRCARAELEFLFSQLEPLYERDHARSAEGHDRSRVADTQVLADGHAHVRQLRAKLAQLPPCGDSGSGRDAAAEVRQQLFDRAAWEALRWILHRVETAICSLLAASLHRLRSQHLVGTVWA